MSKLRSIPWHVGLNEESGEYTVYNNDHFELASGLFHNEACLIAVAPKLLDFVRRVVTEQADMGDHGDAVIISEGEKLIREAGG